MIGLSAERDLYASQFAALAPGRFHSLRKAAFERFVEVGFPHTDQEEWRFTDVTPIARLATRPARAAAAREVSALVARFNFGDVQNFPHCPVLHCSRLVFVNGRFAPEHSVTQKLPPGTRIGSLEAILAEAPELVEPHLARHAEFRDQPFVALNTAFMEEGAVILVPKGAVVEDPIHVLFVTSSDEAPLVSHPRNLFVLGESSHVRIVESYAGTDAGAYFTNAVTEIVAGENAVVDHYRLQREGERAFHVSTLQVEQSRSSTVDTFGISLGGALTRNDVNVRLNGEGACSSLNGLYVGGGAQHVDNHTVIDHRKPHGTSREYYKGILDQKARGVFNGRIIVRPDAQKTDAQQTNKNLLLSKEALANTNPQLEIRADDVKCAHGATIGQLDADAIFYLRARGLDLEAARRVLTYAFVADVQNRIRIEPIRAELERIMFERLAPRLKI